MVECPPASIIKRVAATLYHHIFKIVWLSERWQLVPCVLIGSCGYGHDHEGAIDVWPAAFF
jgi:hypothetical protein